ncbi:MAG: acyl-CoA dehydrogenase [Acidimicrobiaceae bacterium]|nr:acyl-CoA dehydrogenase [Acidimicrobiia bacterium]MCY4494718.1 acyl-CoA dehydrogenase [Acidimicrobiaceae bacterium]
MTGYRAPLDEIRFTLRHVADLDALASLEGFEHADPDLVDGILDESARFFEQAVAPTNRDGDLVGSQRNEDGSVTAAPGLAEVYEQHVAAGWNGVAMPAEHGGGGFPWLLGIAVQEMLTSANMGYSLCPLLTQAAIDALIHHGSESQRETYLPKMVTGEWSGTMNLTEPQAGSDVGALICRARPEGDGTWRIVGQKIFITWGEHDMAQNIIHMVLARTPGAPTGTSGISLFIVPKFLVNDDGSLGERNDVRCVSIEHKLGIHASPTCVMAFGDEGGATGYLIDEENAGMSAMFTMMNNARLSVGLEGVALAERAYQQALEYALQRRQGRAPGAPAGVSSAIVEHPDVQRMLLDMRSATAAMRGLCYRNAEALDLAARGPDEAARTRYSERAALLTPLSKAWCTDLGCELTSVGIQVHGGMGYIEETGAAQHFRDARIAPIYEGTNGIQALDLVGRKLPMRGGGVVADLLASIASTVELAAELPGLEAVAEHLGAAHSAAAVATGWLLEKLRTERSDALAGAAAYLEILAVTTAGQALTDGAVTAVAAAAGPEPALGDDVATDRAVLARFFAANRLARVPGNLAAVTAGADDLQTARDRLLAQ